MMRNNYKHPQLIRSEIFGTAAFIRMDRYTWVSLRLLPSPCKPAGIREGLCIRERLDGLRATRRPQPPGKHPVAQPPSISANGTSEWDLVDDRPGGNPFRALPRGPAFDECNSAAPMKASDLSDRVVQQFLQIQGMFRATESDLARRLWPMARCTSPLDMILATTTNLQGEIDVYGLN